MAAKLVDHLQAVGHLNCISGRCIKSFRPKVGFERTPSNPPVYRPGSGSIHAALAFVSVNATTYTSCLHTRVVVIE